MFDIYVGIDYSGQGNPFKGYDNIQVFQAEGKRRPKIVQPVEIYKRPRKSPYRERLFSRFMVYKYLVELIQKNANQRIIIGIDHAFSFPRSYFTQHGLNDWNQFLTYFRRTWLTLTQPIHDRKQLLLHTTGGLYPPDMQKHLRLTERTTTNAKSVFDLNHLQGVKGPVGFSTHAGIPWIYLLRKRFKSIIHVWPFDGEHIDENKRVVFVEVYPALFYHRYPKPKKVFQYGWRIDQKGLYNLPSLHSIQSRDEEDAYKISKFLQSKDQENCLQSYFKLDHLSNYERKIAVEQEGWI